MSKPIGGFFELESDLSGNQEFHTDAWLLNTGRACLNFIVKAIKPRCVYVPYLTCDAVLQPLRLNNVRISYYHLNEKLEPETAPLLSEGDYFLYINYFGLKNSAIETLAGIYSNHLIIDNSQSFFSKGIRGIFSFNSARKFFGVPDGAYIYTPSEMSVMFRSNEKIQTQHLELRSMGMQEKAFKAFREYEAQIDSEIMLGSVYSKGVLKKINYKRVLSARRTNFNLYHELLGHLNEFQFDVSLTQDELTIPFSYPFYSKKRILFDKLFKKNIFLATYWMDVVNRKENGFSFEEEFCLCTAHLPVDHRYGETEVRFVADNFSEMMKQ